LYLFENQLIYLYLIKIATSCTYL